MPTTNCSRRREFAGNGNSVFSDGLKDSIRKVLNPDNNGNDTLKTELDVLTTEEHYLEGKSGDMNVNDIMAKAIRFRAHQVTGKLDPNGRMMVIGRENKFSMNNKRGDPLKHTRLIDGLPNTEWDTFGGEK